ncbi:acyl-CoA reductase [Chondromyces apiculatus]|uniref:Acyl-CoA reductase n=1 Tax=Chondromyces apiculatus DSM 436 TaxID=1192034 RepID=A0A017T195_9BACT|nr:acyl-CoA reductase [Chondromyces apiculatus]EYF02336.1 Acyl-CoA reductase [Chondromyces apiculatus DSM 436]
MIGEAARRARLECVLTAAQRIADPSDPLGVEARQRLPATSGLSPEGVELALTAHLETHATDTHLRSLLSTTAQAPRCQVVLSANVCTAALRALAVATATAPRVSARPSRRDPVVAELVARALLDDARFQGSIEIVQTPALPGLPGDELHVYGTDATVALLAEKAGPGVVVRGHGTGMGIAVVDAAADVAEAARAIADDVVPFDQRGCLSPRVVLVEGPSLRAESLARALHQELDRAGGKVPRGPLDDATRSEISLYRATIETIGTWWEGCHHGVGLDPDPRALMLPPPARVVHVVPSLAERIGDLLKPWMALISAVGGDGDGHLLEAVLHQLPHARRSALGQMQRPPLDGPVDLRPR